MAPYSTTAGLSMFVLSMLLKQLPNDIVVVVHVTSTFSRIVDVLIAAICQCHSSALNLIMPTS
jgi:hypothetical protein